MNVFVRKRVEWVLLVFLITGCDFYHENIKGEVKGINVLPKVIYGDDDRHDVHEVGDEDLVELSRSTVALMRPASLEYEEDVYKVVASSFGEVHGLCSDEPYYDQPSAVFCSGSLIGEDLVLTAGHCIRYVKDCEQVRFVFGYQTDEQGEVIREIPESDVYSCAELIQTEQSYGGADFAIVRLDRKVEDREPLTLRLEGQVEEEDEVFVLGYPSGLPLKITLNGRVRRLEEEFFVASVDTYGGNSGSAVLSSATGEVEGILVRGERDFVRDGDCYRSNHCLEDECRGEEITYVSQILPYLPEEEEPDDEGNDSDENDSDEGEIEELIYRSYVEVPIPDYDVEGVSSILEGVEGPDGRRVKIEVNIRHTWVGDLILKLRDPLGRVYQLRHREGSYQNNIVGIYGEDLTSDDDLSELSGISVEGNWTLIVVDAMYRDVGVLEGWALHILP